MRDKWIGHVLKEERRAAKAVEADTVGNLRDIELLLLGEDLIDIRLELRVGFDEFGSQRSLCGGFDFGLRAWRESMRMC